MSNFTKVAYFNNCAALGRAVLEELIDQHGLDVDACQDAAYEHVSESVDSSAMAIYMQHHLPILQFSTHADYFVDEFGSESAGDVLKEEGLDGLHAAVAVYCIQADVMAWLSENLEDTIEQRIEELGGEAC